MNNPIAWPALIVGAILTLISASLLVALRVPSSSDRPTTAGWVKPITGLALTLLLLAGLLLALWALNLRGTLGR